MKKGILKPMGFACVLLVLFLCRDKLVSAYFSPEGMLLKALPAAESALRQNADDEKAGEGSIVFDVVEIDYDVDAEILFELLDTESSTEITEHGQTPTILIYHTHATEAYLPTEEAPYEQTTRWRTNDPQNSVIAVGEALAQELRSYGYNVIHDTTNYEPPVLSSAYERSLQGMERYQEKYPDIALFIDLHRDAYELDDDATMEEYAGIDDTVTINGETCARLMFVVGTGEGSSGNEFSVRPDYQTNYSLALGITEYLETVKEGFTRPIRVKTGRYNQHMGVCLLIEVGHNANTLEEAKNAVKYFAKAIAELQ